MALGMDFLGLQVLSYRISGRREIADITRFGDPAPEHIVLSEDITASIQVWAPDKLDLLTELWHQGAEMRSLGAGHHCAYCNTAWVPGVLICPNCGAPTDYRPGVLAYERAALLTNIEIIQSVHSGHKVYLEMRLARSPDRKPDWAALLLGGPAAWVCPFCGLYVRGGAANCPGCGGNRLPVKELRGLQRVCVYCGRTTWGNYACPACGGRLRGQL